MKNCNYCGRAVPDHREDCKVTVACNNEVARIRRWMMALTDCPQGMSATFRPEAGAYRGPEMVLIPKAEYDRLVSTSGPTKETP